jgi:hypothetical protein
MSEILSTDPEDEQYDAADRRPSPSRGRVCQATNQYGRPCQAKPQSGKDICWVHDPENAQERARISLLGRKAATRRSPQSLEIEDLKSEVKALIREVNEGAVTPNVASVICQLANVLIRGIEQNRKVGETEEIEERLAELERKAETGGRGAAA